MSALTVNDLMTTNPITAPPQASLHHILTLMKQHNIRQIPIVEDENGLVGIITDRDVRLAMNSPLILHDRKQDLTLFETLTAESCMTPDPITVSPHTPAHRAAQLLITHKFGALPVVTPPDDGPNAGPTLIGILTVTDFLNHFISHFGPHDGAAPKDTVDG